MIVFYKFFKFLVILDHDISLIQPTTRPPCYQETKCLSAQNQITQQLHIFGCHGIWPACWSLCHLKALSPSFAQ